jgi:hypothetical protein
LKEIDDIKSISAEYNNITDKITVGQLVELLLGLNNISIKDRILLFNELFLLYQELKTKGIQVQDPEFATYRGRHGAYSFLIAETVDLMRDAGIVKIVGKKNTGSEEFSINKDIADLLSKHKELNDILDYLRRRRKGMDQLGTDGILRYVYQNYPEFKSKHIMSKNK